MNAVSYMQTDPRWKNISYSAKGESTTIGKAGCGPTCAAMVIATWKDKTVTPKTAAAWSLSHSYKAFNQGTYYTYFKPQMAAYGITCTQLNSSNLRNMTAAKAKPYHDQVVSALKNGDLVIACMGKGLWTSSGHFILLRGISGTTVYINDPNSTVAVKTKGNLSLLQSQVKYYFVCKKPIIKTVPKAEVKKAMEVLEKWQKEQGLKALDSLTKKGIIENPTNWKNKMGDSVPVWLLFTMFDRMSKK
jgi:hypothetical protein